MASNTKLSKCLYPRQTLRCQSTVIAVRILSEEKHLHAILEVFQQGAVSMRSANVQAVLASDFRFKSSELNIEYELYEK